MVAQQPIEAAHPILNSQTLGISLVLLGVIVIGLAAWHYSMTFQQIESNRYRPSRWMVWTITGVVMVIGILSIPILLVRAFDPPGNRAALQTNRQGRALSRD